MKNKRKRIIAGCLSVLLLLSVVMAHTTTLETIAAQKESTGYSNAGTMQIVSRRVTKPELYDNVPQVQKTVNGNNSVAVLNEMLSVQIEEEEVIDYIRFFGASDSPTQRKADAQETIDFHATYHDLAGVSDWTNLPICVGKGETTVTATNFLGEGTVLTFSIDTVAGENRSLTIYAGGHPNTGTITASAVIGKETMAVCAGDVTDCSYAFTPNSSQVTEYRVDYKGTGEKLVVTLSLTGTNAVSWAGIAVAGAILQEVEETEKEESPVCMSVADKFVSKSSLYEYVPNIQKTVNEKNPVAVEDKVVSLNLNTTNVVDYMRFTGNEQPERKEDGTTKRLHFTCTNQGISDISDWDNLQITYGTKNATTTATNFLGENASVTFEVETRAGEECTLDLYVGGHPNTGTYTTFATLGEEVVSVTAGQTTANAYSYTPKSSQIVHYEVAYIGNGETLSVTIEMTDTAGVSWAGIGVAAAVLKEDISSLNPQIGSFCKSSLDVEYADVCTTLTLAKNSVLEHIFVDEEVLSDENYCYDESTSTLSFPISYLEKLTVGEHAVKIALSSGEFLDYAIKISDAYDTPRPYVKEKESLSNADLDAWTLWYQDEFDETLNDWWEPSYLKWWNYSSQSNEQYNIIEYSKEAGSNVLKQFTTENMRADSIVTRRDNFRNPGITLGVRDLIHNYGANDLTNYQHMPTDDRGATAYGYFEIRAKITGGTTEKTQSGSSAWWFTGFQDASWQTVEVDMVEYGYGVSESNLNAHFASPMHSWRDPFVYGNNSTWNSTDKTLTVEKPADDYHIYGFEWTPTGMKGYFDGVLVWSKNMSVNYRMLMWISLNSHAYDTYTTDAKSHYIDYVRIWKTEQLEMLEKQLVTKNIVQKQAPIDDNVATLAYAGANGIRSSYYQKYDPAYLNDGDSRTSYRATSKQEREKDAYPVTPYPNKDQYLYLDWVTYTSDEIADASDERETITDLNGVAYTLASEKEIRSAKTIAAVELSVNQTVITKTINAEASDLATGTFVYDETEERVNLFPYEFDIEYSEDGQNGWIAIANDVKAQWVFDESGESSFAVNVNPIQNVNHLRIHVKSVWNSETNQVETTENGFYIAEIKVYETPRNADKAERKETLYNHAPYAKITVTDKNGEAGSEDSNFPVCDVADGVYVNEFRSSGDGVRLLENANRVDTSVENVPSYPQYIHFLWDCEKTIDSFVITIGKKVSAPTRFELQALQEDGTWKTIVAAEETWEHDFEQKAYFFDAETTTCMRMAILEANKGPAIAYNGGIESNPSRIVKIAGGYYSIAEIELNQKR